MRRDLFTGKEYETIRNIPDRELLDLASELEILIEDSEIDRIVLAERLVRGFRDQTIKGPLPISRYNREDLEGFGRDELYNFFNFMGIRFHPGEEKEKILKKGIKVCEKAFRRYPRTSLVVNLLPVFLPPLVRYINRGEE